MLKNHIADFIFFSGVTGSTKRLGTVRQPRFPPSMASKFLRSVCVRYTDQRPHRLSCLPAAQARCQTPWKGQEVSLAATIFNIETIKKKAVC
jgi:hypothetical protein